MQHPTLTNCYTLIIAFITKEHALFASSRSLSILKAALSTIVSSRLATPSSIGSSASTFRSSYRSSPNGSTTRLVAPPNTRSRCMASSSPSSTSTSPTRRYPRGPREPCAASLPPPQRRRDAHPTTLQKFRAHGLDIDVYLTIHFELLRQAEARGLCSRQERQYFDTSHVRSNTRIVGSRDWHK